MAAQIDRRIESMAEALADADVDLAVEVAGLVEQSKARAWKGQVLVEWERDDDAGGCLLRPDLVERLIKLGATAIDDRNSVKLRAGPRLVASLSPHHGSLDAQLGHSPGLRLTLRFDAAGRYVGGEERYVVDARGPAAVTLLRLEAKVQPRPAQPPSGQTSTAPA